MSRAGPPSTSKPNSSTAKARPDTVATDGYLAAIAFTDRFQRPQSALQRVKDTKATRTELEDYTLTGSSAVVALLRAFTPRAAKDGRPLLDRPDAATHIDMASMDAKTVWKKLVNKKAIEKELNPRAFKVMGLDPDDGDDKERGIFKSTNGEEPRADKKGTLVIVAAFLKPDQRNVRIFVQVDPTQCAARRLFVSDPKIECITHTSSLCRTIIPLRDDSGDVRRDRNGRTLHTAVYRAPILICIQLLGFMSQVPVLEGTKLPKGDTLADLEPQDLAPALWAENISYAKLEDISLLLRLGHANKDANEDASQEVQGVLGLTPDWIADVTHHFERDVLMKLHDIVISLRNMEVILCRNWVNWLCTHVAPGTAPVSRDYPDYLLELTSWALRELYWFMEPNRPGPDVRGIPPLRMDTQAHSTPPPVYRPRPPPVYRPRPPHPSPAHAASYAATTSAAYSAGPINFSARRPNPPPPNSNPDPYVPQTSYAGQPQVFASHIPYRQGPPGRYPPQAPPGHYSRY
ncbi:hypothetical protein JCM11641_006095 [Rhodosporidiobolus odoratus]